MRSLTCDRLLKGFSTTNFDLTANLTDDQRAGLDEQGLTEVRRIMERHKVDFDEARRIRTSQHFKKNGVDEFGFPIGQLSHLSLYSGH